MSTLLSPSGSGPSGLNSPVNGDGSVYFPATSGALTRANSTSVIPDYFGMNSVTYPSLVQPLSTTPTASSVSTRQQLKAKKIGAIDRLYDVHRIVAHMQAALEGIPTDLRHQPAHLHTEQSSVKFLAGYGAEEGRRNYEGVSLTYDQHTAHVISLRREYIHRLARPLVQKLIQHPKNTNIFNFPVDPVALKLVGYKEKITKPMDLGTIKTRLQCGQYYEDIESVFDDVRLVFNNAISFNGKTHFVGQVASEMLQEFEHDVSVLEEKVAKEKEKELKDEHHKPHHGHSGRGRSQSLSFSAASTPGSGNSVGFGSLSAQHRCTQCEGDLCLLCGEKCQRLEQPVLFCSSPNCSAKIKRGSIYYITSDGMVMWCQKCYASLPDVIRDPSSGKYQSKQHLKSTLLRRKFEEECFPTEGWVKCGQCSHRFHEVCALHCRYLAVRQSWTAPGSIKSLTNSSKPPQPVTDDFICALCHLGNAQRVKTALCELLFPLPTTPSTGSAGRRLSRSNSVGSVSMLSKQHTRNAMLTHSQSLSCIDTDLALTKPVSLTRQVSVLPGDNCGLPSAPMSPSEGVIAVTKENATELLDGVPMVVEDDAVVPAAMDSLRAIEPSTWRASTLPRTQLSDFLEQVVKDLLHAKGYESWVSDSITIRVVTNIKKSLEVPAAIHENLSPCPDKMPYMQKCVLLFQSIDGIDVCLFCLYVHEFGSTSPSPNTGLTYIAYLDSVDYLRPASARSLIYQEIVTGYLAWSRARGFNRCHFWACPPQRGDNFIFWCHPAHQRTPSRERLNNWYNAILARCKVLGLLQPPPVTQTTGNGDQHQFATYFAKYLVANSDSTVPTNGSGYSSRSAQKRNLEAMQQQLLGVSSDNANNSDNGSSKMGTSKSKKSKKQTGVSKKERVNKAQRVSEASGAVASTVTVSDVTAETVAVSESLHDESVPVNDSDPNVAMVTMDDATVMETNTVSESLPVTAVVTIPITDRDVVIVAPVSTAEISSEVSESVVKDDDLLVKEEDVIVAEGESVPMELSSELDSVFTVSEITVTQSDSVVDSVVSQSEVLVESVSESVIERVTDEVSDAVITDSIPVSTSSQSLSSASTLSVAPSSHLPVCPPVFEGDFWVLEYIRLHRVVMQRNRFTSDQQTGVNQKKCKDIIKVLLTKPMSSPFRVPVDPIGLCIPQYFNVIKRPMDLGTVKEKLRSTTTVAAAVSSSSGSISGKHSGSIYRTMLDFVNVSDITSILCLIM